MNSISKQFPNCVNWACTDCIPFAHYSLSVDYVVPCAIPNTGANFLG